MSTDPLAVDQLPGYADGSFLRAKTSEATGLDFDTPAESLDAMLDTVMTTDGDLVTRSSGAPARITRAALAADPAFSSTYAPAHSGALVRLSAAESIANSTLTDVPWDVEVYDEGGWWVVGSPTRLTVPAGVSKVRLTGCVAWASATAGERLFRILKNGAGVYGLPQVRNVPGATSSIYQAASSAVITATPGDYFTLNVRQISGGALNITADPESYFSIEKVA